MTNINTHQAPAVEPILDHYRIEFDGLTVEINRLGKKVECLHSDLLSRDRETREPKLTGDAYKKALKERDDASAELADLMTLRASLQS